MITFQQPSSLVQAYLPNLLYPTTSMKCSFYFPKCLLQVLAEI